MLECWSRIPAEQLNPAMRRQMLHTGNMTIARLEISAGARVPAHSHHNEQVSMVLSGRLKFLLEGSEVVVGAGECMVLEPNQVHGVEALEDAVVIDLFSPRREDWIRGDDAYLRG